MNSGVIDDGYQRALDKQNAVSYSVYCLQQRIRAIKQGTGEHWLICIV